MTVSLGLPPQARWEGMKRRGGSVSLSLTPQYDSPHAKQSEVITSIFDSKIKRHVLLWGRRAGKTIGMSQIAAEGLRRGMRVLYSAPTADQTERFWYAVRRYFANDVSSGTLEKNESQRRLERPNAGENDARIRAKTAWNSDTIRGDWGSLILLDEYQLMKGDLDDVILPMLLDTGGIVVYAGTPPKSASRTNQLRVKWERAEDNPRWHRTRITSHENPHLDRDALEEITEDMPESSPQFRREINAEFIDEVEGALWSKETIASTRINKTPQFNRIVVAIDPASWTGETGICVVGGAVVNGETHAYILSDATTSAEPSQWANTAISEYYKNKATLIIYEKNQGGKMIPHTIQVYDDKVPMKDVHASIGKISRAEPVEGMYRKGRVHHVGFFDDLEAQMTTYIAGSKSPDRMDAMVWGVSEILGLGTKQAKPQPQIINQRVPQFPHQGIGYRPRRRRR